LFAATVLVLLLAACSVKVDDKDKDAKKVDIQTPLANLKVDTSEASTDNGIPVYPGATPRPEENGDKHRANVNIGAMGFGIKVIAAEYNTPDSPEKVKTFYLDKLKKFGNVLECRGTGGDHGSKGDWNNDEGDKPVSCGDTHGDGWELKPEPITTSTWSPSSPTAPAPVSAPCWSRFTARKARCNTVLRDALERARLYGPHQRAILGSAGPQSLP